MSDQKSKKIKKALKIAGAVALAAGAAGATYYGAKKFKQYRNKYRQVRSYQEPYKDDSNLLDYDIGADEIDSEEYYQKLNKAAQEQTRREKEFEVKPGNMEVIQMSRRNNIDLTDELNKIENLQTLRDEPETQTPAIQNPEIIKYNPPIDISSVIEDVFSSRKPKKTGNSLQRIQGL